MPEDIEPRVGGRVSEFCGADGGGGGIVDREVESVGHGEVVCGAVEEPEEFSFTEFGTYLTRFLDGGGVIIARADKAGGDIAPVRCGEGQPVSMSDMKKTTVGVKTHFLRRACRGWPW